MVSNSMKDANEMPDGLLLAMHFQHLARLKILLVHPFLLSVHKCVGQDVRRRNYMYVNTVIN
jgi:hypothetical protein